MNYLVIRKATTLTNRGFTADVILSKHKTLQSAEKAFNKVVGACQLKAVNGAIIDYKMV